MNLERSIPAAGSDSRRNSFFAASNASAEGEKVIVQGARAGEFNDKMLHCETSATGKLWVRPTFELHRAVKAQADAGQNWAWPYVSDRHIFQLRRRFSLRLE